MDTRALLGEQCPERNPARDRRGTHSGYAPSTPQGLLPKEFGTLGVIGRLLAQVDCHDTGPFFVETEFDRTGILYAPSKQTRHDQEEQRQRDLR